MEEKVEKTIQLHFIKADDLPKLLAKETKITLVPVASSNSIKVMGQKADVDKAVKFIIEHLDVSANAPSEVLISIEGKPVLTEKTYNEFLEAYSKAVLREKKDLEEFVQRYLEWEASKKGSAKN